jgi:hypothetical protein
MDAILGWCIIGYVCVALFWAYMARFVSKPNGSGRTDDWGMLAFLGGVFWVPVLVVWGLTALYNFLRIANAVIWVKDKIDWGTIHLLKKEIQRDSFGILYESRSPYGLMKIVKVEDSTGVYWLTVPRNIERAKEGVAWTYGLSEEAYNPLRS